MSLTFTANAQGLSSNIPAVASMTNGWAKGQIKVDAINALTSGTTMALHQIDQDGAGTNVKWQAQMLKSDATHHQIKMTGAGSVISSASVLSSALPANGSLVNFFFGWTNLTQYMQLTDPLGNVITDGTNSFLVANSANNGPLSTTGGANGEVTINAQSGASRASTWYGFAIYSTGTIPAAATAPRYSVPSPSDANIVGFWRLNDATSGTTPTSASASVGNPLVLSGTYNWSGVGTNQWVYIGAPPIQPKVASFGARHRSFYY